MCYFAVVCRALHCISIVGRSCRSNFSGAAKNTAAPLVFAFRRHGSDTNDAANPLHIPTV